MASSAIFETCIKHADALYVARDGAEQTHARLEAWLRAAQGKFAAPEERYELLWRGARAHFFRGQEIAVTRAEQREAYTSGSAVAARAAALFPARVEAWFWAGVNLALQAQSEYKLAAARHALAARRYLRRAARIDESYHAAGALRVRARLESRLPKLLGGSRKTAQELYERALAVAPHNSVTRLYYAEFWLEQNARAAAREQLEKLLSAPLDEFWRYERARDERRARELLERISG